MPGAPHLFNISKLRSSIAALVSGHKLACLMAMLLLLGHCTFGATATTTSTGGDWATASTWAAGVVPDSTDDIVLAPGATVSVSASYTACLSLALNNGCTLIVDNGSLLNINSVAGLYLNNGAGENVSSLIAGDGTVTCKYLGVGGGVTLATDSATYTTTLTSSISALIISKDLTLTSGFDTTNKVNNATFNLESGSVTVNGTIYTLNANVFNVSSISMGAGAQSGTLNVAGATPFLLSATGTNYIQFNGASATVNYINSGPQDVLSTGYNNLTLGGSGAKSIGVVTVNGLLLMSGSATCIGSVINYGSSATIEYAGSSAQATGSELPAVFNGSGGVIINNSSGVTLNAVTTIGYSLQMASGTLDLHGYTTSAGDLQGGGNVTCLAPPNVSLYTGSDNADAIFSGSIEDGTGVVSVIKNGTGRWTLTGASTFTGGMTLNNGVLSINNPQALGDVASTFIINGGNIDNTSTGTITTVNYPETWNSGFAFIGTQSLDMGTGPVTMSTTCDITVDSNTLTIGGAISGTGFGLIKDGAGALALGGANTFNGGTILNEGTLDINNTQALGNSTGTFSIYGGVIDNTTSGPISTLNYPQLWNAGFTFGGTQNLNMGSGDVTIKGDIQITTNADTLTENGNISTSSFSLSKTGSGTLSFVDNAVAFNNLIIDNGTLVSTSANLSLAGYYTNNGNYVHNGGTATFRGPSTQSISGISNTTFNNLTLNGLGGVTLNKPITVVGNLTLTNGLLNTDSINLISLTATGTVTGANNNSFVNGPVMKTGNTAFVFPVGRWGTGYQAIGISAPVADTDAITAQYVRVDPHGLGSVLGDSLTNVSYCEYWLLNHTTGLSSVQVSLYGNSNSGCGPTLGANYFTGKGAAINDLRVAYYNAATTEWENQGGTTTGLSPDITTTSFGTGSLGAFTFGSTGGNPLPVTLLSFNAAPVNGNSLLQWATALEINNNFFAVERSADGINFTEIGAVKGADNSTAEQYYNYTDTLSAFASQTTWYYRLKQVDNNGNYSYSNVAAVNFANQTPAVQVTTLPNPFTNTFTVNCKSQLGQNIDIDVFDAEGRKITGRKIFAEAGFNKVEFNLSSYASGIYLVRVINGEGNSNYRIVKE